MGILFLLKRSLSSLSFSLPHFPTLPPRPTHCLAFSPFPEIVVFPTLLLPDTTSSDASWLSPLPFCAKLARLLCSLCRCWWGQHTHEALLHVHFINQKAAFCSLCSLSSVENFFSSPSPFQPLLLPYILLPHRKLGNFLHVFLSLTLKTSLFLPILHPLLLLPDCHLCC